MHLKLTSVRGHYAAFSAGVSWREKMALFPGPVKKVSRGQIVRVWLPIPEAAAVLRVSRRQVERLIKAGRLHAAAVTWPKSGFRWRYVTRRSVEDYAKSRYVAKSP